MTTPDQPDGAFKLAYDEAKGAVVQQASALDALRSQAGTLLAAASVATSFLGALALGTSQSASNNH
jgi:hypothetical protein